MAPPPPPTATTLTLTPPPAGAMAGVAVGFDDGSITFHALTEGDGGLAVVAVGAGALPPRAGGAPARPLALAPGPSGSVWALDTDGRVTQVAPDGRDAVVAAPAVAAAGGDDDSPAADGLWASFSAALADRAGAPPPAGAVAAATAAALTAPATASRPALAAALAAADANAAAAAASTAHLADVRASLTSLITRGGVSAGGEARSAAAVAAGAARAWRGTHTAACFAAGATAAATPCIVRHCGPLLTTLRPASGAEALLAGRGPAAAAPLAAAAAAVRSALSPCLLAAAASLQAAPTGAAAGPVLAPSLADAVTAGPVDGALAARAQRAWRARARGRVAVPPSPHRRRR